MYCSNCGTQLPDQANFCFQCGVATAKSEQNIKDLNVESIEFSSSILLGGDILTPDRVIITATGVVYKKRNKNLIGVDEISIPFRRIGSVRIDRKIISSSIIITTTGSEEVKLANFSISDAKKIKRIIEERIV